MQVNAMPFAVQLRELHRQELYDEADRERLVRQAPTPGIRCDVDRLWVLLTGIWESVVGPGNQTAPIAMDMGVLATDDP